MEKSYRWPIISINYSDGDHGDLFVQNIEQRLYHTDIYDEIDIETGGRAVAFISTEPDRINYLGLYTRGQKIASKKRRFKIWKTVELESPLTKESLIQSLKPIFHKSVNKFFKSFIFSAPDKFGDDLLNHIFENRGDLRTIYLELINSYSPDSKSNDVGFIQETEIEAIALSLILSGVFDHYKGAFYQNSESAEGFLNGLAEVEVREDLQIINDSRIFDDWEMKEADISGNTTFSNGLKQVHVIYANRTPLEENIGVDLIYYNETSKSFIMVQYKRMIQEHSKWLYRPLLDNNHAKELKRMKDFAASQFTDSKSEYKFNNDTFYFKLCKSKQQRSRGALSTGMYIPLAYWDFLLSSKQTLGPRDGRVFSFDNIPNYLTNSVFTGLVQTGLIGSRVADAKHIGEIIEELLASGKSLILSKCSQQN
jgi:hypothetical protein